MERFTEYHAGVAVIKDKNKMKDAMKRFAELEDRATAKEVMLQSKATYKFKKTGLCPTCGKEVRGHMKHCDYCGQKLGWNDGRKES